MNPEQIRERIDAIDESIVTLLNERATHAIAIGEAKRAQGIPVRDAEREAQVLAKVTALNKGPLKNPMVEGLYRKIMDSCLDLELNP